MFLSQFQAYCGANKLLYLTRASRHICRNLTILKLDFPQSEPAHDGCYTDCATR